MARPTKGRKAKQKNPFPPKPQEEQKHSDEWERDLNPDRMAGQNYRGAPVGNDPRARTAADVKMLSAKLAEFTRDQLAEIPIVPVGTKLKQGAVYLDLRHPSPAPFTATAEMIAQDSNYYTAKAEVPYELWNRLLERVSPGQLQQGTTAQGAGEQPFSPRRGEQEAALEKARASKAGDKEPEDGDVDQTGAESFPASDPPSWTTGREKTGKPS